MSKKQRKDDNLYSINEKRINKDNYSRLFNYFKLLSMNRYKWINLPNGMLSKFIEDALFNRGQAMFFEDKIYGLGLLCLPSSTAGALNVYGEPISVNVVGKGNGYSANVKMVDGVRIRNNDLLIPSFIEIDYYARKMANIDWHIARNLQLQAKPYIIVASKQTLLSAKNIQKDIEEGKEAIVVDESMFDRNGKGLIDVLPTLSNYNVDKLETLKKDLECELLTRLGLNNKNSEKKERLLVDETNANNEYIEFNLELEYKTRLQACEHINKKYGLNISVVKTTDYFENEVE